MIVYFSGTGNSHYVSGELARLLNEDSPVSVVGDSITDDVLARAARIVWVFPVYSWGVPPVVVDVMKRIRLSALVPCWMVCTCGDDVGLAPRQWRALVCAMGGHPRGAFSVEMPNTYVTMPGFDVDSADVARRKLESAPARLNVIASMIRDDRGVTDVVRGRFPWLKSRVVYPWFIRHAMSPRPFASTDACIGCGRCERECPMHNIRLDASRRPQWADNCAFCLRCYHTCPVQAVTYGRTTRNKGQYLCPLQ